MIFEPIVGDKLLLLMMFDVELVVVEDDDDDDDVIDRRLFDVELFRILLPLVLLLLCLSVLIKNKIRISNQLENQAFVSTLFRVMISIT